jgi:hypothetical protein
LLQPGYLLAKQLVFHGLLADLLTEPADFNRFFDRMWLETRFPGLKEDVAPLGQRRGGHPQLPAHQVNVLTSKEPQYGLGFVTRPKSLGRSFLSLHTTPPERQIHTAKLVSKKTLGQSTLGLGLTLAGQIVSQRLDTEKAPHKLHLMPGSDRAPAIPAPA